MTVENRNRIAAKLKARDGLNYYRVSQNEVAQSRLVATHLGPYARPKAQETHLWGFLMAVIQVQDDRLQELEAAVKELKETKEEQKPATRSVGRPPKNKED